MFTLARARRQAALLVALAVSAAVIVGAAGLVQNTVSDAGQTGVREALQQLPSEDLALRLSMPAIDDSDALDVEVRDALDTVLPGLPFGVVRTSESRVDISNSDRVVVASVTDDDALDLVTGAWPAADGETAIQADAAEDLDLAIGDPIEIGEASFVITGTWRVQDANDPRWLGDPVWTTGVDLDLHGPVLITEEAWQSVGLSPTLRWTVVPDISRVSGDDLGRFRAGWSALPDELVDRGIESGTRSGGFLRAARTTGERYAALQASIPISLTAFAGVAALALWEFGGLFARARAEEDLMLWARGTTRRRIALRAGMTAAVTAALGGAIAAVATDAIGWAVASVVVAALAFAARASVRTRDVARTGRGRRTAGVGGVAVLAAIAAVATWQLLSQGLLSRSDGETSVDPVTVLAPGAVLLTIVVVGLALLPVALRRPGTTAGVGAGRGVVRRVGLIATSVIAIGLAVGQIAVAAGFAETWRQSFAETQAMHAGAVLRISNPGGLDEETQTTAAGIGAVAPARNDAATVGGESIEIVGVAPGALAMLGATPEADELARALTAEPPALPEGATTVEVAADGGVPARLRLSDSFGFAVTVDLDAGAPTLLPTTEHGPWRVTAIDITPSASDETTPDPETGQPAVGGPGTEEAGAGQSVTVTSVTTDAGDVSLDGTWTGISFPGGPEAFEGLSPPTDTPTAGVYFGDRIARVVAAPAPAAVVTASVADLAGIEAGQVFTVDYGGAQPVYAGAVVAAVPGSRSADAVLVDLWSIEAVMLRARESIRPPRTAWIDAPPSTAPQLREALPQVLVQTAEDDPDQRMLAAGPAALWIAAAGTGLLALAAVAASCAALVRLRRDEVGVLRALGVRPREQVSLRHRELALVAGWGALIGAIGGGAVVLLAAGTLARASVPDPYPSIPTQVRWDAGAAGIWILALALGIGVVAFLYGRAVARQARKARA